MGAPPRAKARTYLALSGILMSRPLLLFIVAVVVLLLILVGLAALDRPVTTTHVEQPVGNAAAH